MVSNVEPFLHRKSDIKQRFHLPLSQRTVLRDIGGDSSGASGQEIHRYNTGARQNSRSTQREISHRGEIAGVLTEKNLRAIGWQESSGTSTCCRDTERQWGLRLFRKQDNPRYRAIGCYSYPKGANYVGQDLSSTDDSRLRSVRIHSRDFYWLKVASLALVFLLIGKALVYGENLDVFALSLQSLSEIRVNK